MAVQIDCLVCGNTSFVERSAPCPICKRSLNTESQVGAPEVTAVRITDAGGNTQTFITRRDLPMGQAIPKFIDADELVNELLIPSGFHISFDDVGYRIDSISEDNGTITLDLSPYHGGLRGRLMRWWRLNPLRQRLQWWKLLLMAKIETWIDRR